MKKPIRLFPGMHDLALNRPVEHHEMEQYGRKATAVDHAHNDRQIGYQDAMRDLRECITATGKTRTAVALWLEKGREWRQ